jgi:hypothetical protein
MAELPSRPRAGGHPRHVTGRPHRGGRDEPWPLGAPSEWPLPWLWYVVHPDSGVTPGDYDGMTVQVTGHYDDPAAQGCRITDDYSNEVTPAEAIDTCRATFVVTRMVPSAH